MSWTWNWRRYYLRNVFSVGSSVIWTRTLHSTLFCFFAPIEHHQPFRVPPADGAQSGGGQRRRRQRLEPHVQSGPRLRLRRRIRLVAQHLPRGQCVALSLRHRFALSFQLYYAIQYVVVKSAISIDRASLEFDVGNFFFGGGGIFDVMEESSNNLQGKRSQPFHCLFLLPHLNAISFPIPLLDSFAMGTYIVLYTTMMDKSTIGRDGIASGNR